MPPTVQFPELKDKSAQGGSLLVQRARDFIDKVTRYETIDEPAPTIATANGVFSPVLVYTLLSACPEPQPAIQGSQPFRKAAAIVGVLEALRDGKHSHAASLGGALKQSLMGPFRMHVAEAYFDFLYGALQLLVLERETEPTRGNKELFQLAVAHIYSLAAMGRPDLPYHVEHFLAHAAIFIAMKDASDSWPAVVREATVLIESWGMSPPPDGVFVHCALNLEMKCRQMPASDLPYDLIKFLRARVRHDQMTPSEAFEVMTLTIGWRQASGLLRVLWPDTVNEYSRFERDRIEKMSSEGAEDIRTIATRRKFCSGLGIPYLRTDQPLTEANQFALSFPGGWTIGGTSIICKAGKFRMLLDCGATALGPAGAGEPDLDLIDVAMISHAHQDHIGGLLEFYRRGYRGVWYATRQTGLLGRLTLQDAIKLHRDMYGPDALYDDVLLETVMDKFIPVDYGVEIDLDEEISIKPFPAGHVPGSCQWQIRNRDSRFVFSGDFNLRPNLSDATRSLEYPSPDEVNSTIGLVVEGTYALSSERLLDNFEARESLIEQIRNSASRPVLIPVLSLGRAQEVCAALSSTEFRVGVFGLAARMTRAVSRLLGENIVFDERPPSVIKAHEFDVLVASSGCLQGGPSKLFYESPRFQEMPVILTGHIFPGTPARAIMDRVPRVRFSAHAAAEDWHAYVERFGNARKFVIHLPGWPKPSSLDGMDVPHRHAEYLLKALPQESKVGLR